MRNQSSNNTQIGKLSALVILTALIAGQPFGANSSSLLNGTDILIDQNVVRLAQLNNRGIELGLDPLKWPETINSVDFTQADVDLDPDELGLITSAKFNLTQYIAKHRKFEPDYLLVNLSIPTAFTEIAKINVSGNQDLIDLGLNGSGTLNDPFIISNSTIITNDTRPAIRIANTDLFLQIISNQIIHNGSIGPDQGGIIISNSTNINLLGSIYTSAGSGNSSRGIEVSLSTKIGIVNNTFSDYVQIDIFDSSNIQIINNNMINPTGNGLNIVYSSDLDLAYNTMRVIARSEGVFGGNDPVRLVFIKSSNNLRIYGNEITGIGPHDPDSSELHQPIRMDDVSSVEVFNNDFAELGNLRINANRGLNIVSNNFRSAYARSVSFACTGSDIVVSHNMFKDSANILKGTSLGPSDSAFGTEGANISILDNVFEGGFNYGAVTLGGDTALIENNIMRENDNSGIYLEGASNVIIRENILQLNKRGIQGSKSIDRDDNQVILINDNQISGNLREGIRLDSSDEVLISENRIFDNDVGISFGGGEGITVTQNDIHDNGAFGIAVRDRSVLISLTLNELSFNSGFGISLNRATSTVVNENDIHENELGGLLISDSEEIVVKNNQFTTNGIVGISILQATNPNYIVVQNNILEDHADDGSYALDLVSNYPESNYGINVFDNQILDNKNGIRIQGSNLNIHDNRIDISDDSSVVMNTGVEFDFGTRNNVFVFNFVNSSSFFHIVVRSGPGDLESVNNLIAWNDFYDFGVLSAFDHTGKNNFIYNYWAKHAVSPLSDELFVSKPWPISSSFDLEQENFDYFPLNKPVDRDALITQSNAELPAPRIEFPGNNTEIVKSDNGSQILTIDWTQFISLDHFMLSNKTDLSFDLLISEVDGSGALEKNITDIRESEFLWDVTNLKKANYKIQIETQDRATGRNSSALIIINFGPVVDEPLPIVPIVAGGAVLLALSVYGVTTYRHRLQLRREADVEGRAQDYLDEARRIQEDET